MSFGLNKIQFTHAFINKWFLIAASIAVTGIFFSRAMISIGMIGIVLLFFMTKGWKKSFCLNGKDLILFFLAPVFILYLIGGIWTENHAYWWERVQVKLPLLFLPLGFWSVKEIIEKKTVDRIICLFVFLCFVTALGSFINYLFHYKAINESYKHAKTIPVIIEHIRYSLMLAISFFASVMLYRCSPIITSKTAKRIVAVMGIFILFFMHLHSVRSGLLALYATLFISLLILVIQKGDRRFLLFIPVVMAGMLLMYLFIPSLHNKVDYMKRDVNRFVDGKSVNNYSDGNRLLSMKIGIELGLQYPVIGVGSGDVQEAMDEIYKQEYPDIDPKNRLVPHNQFVYIFTALGFCGILIFIGCLLLPVLTKEIFTNIFCLAVLISSYTSFLTEATLEVQQGIVVVCLLFSIAYTRIHSLEK